MANQEYTLTSPPGAAHSGTPDSESCQSKTATNTFDEDRRAYATLLSNLPGMAYRCRNDAQWTIEFVSDGCFDLTGYRPDELIENRTVAYGSLVHAEDKDSVWQGVQEALFEGRPFQLVYRIIVRDGEEKWVWEQGRAVSTAGGERRLEGFITDITARQIAEEKMRRSEARARALAHTAARLNAELDLQTVLHSVCEEAIDALNVPAASVMLYDEKSDEFRVASALGLPPDYVLQYKGIPRALYDEYARTAGLVISNPDVRTISGLSGAALYAEQGVRSFVVATMARNGELIGALSVITLGQVRHFREDELALLQAMADQAAQAIANARLFEQANRRLRRLRALNAIDRAITARLELPETLNVVLEQVATQLEVDAAAILLLNRQTQVLEYAAGRGFHGQAVQRSRVALGEGYSGRVALEQRTIVISDLGQAEGFVQAPLLVEEGFIAYCGVPLVAQGALLGVLAIFQRSSLDQEEEWTAFLEALATQAAIAIDSASLYAETLRLIEKSRFQAMQVRQIVDTLPEGVLLLNTQRRVILANPLGETYLAQLSEARSGGVLSQLGGRPLAELLETAEAGNVWQDVRCPQSEQIFEVAAQPVKNIEQVGGWVLVLRNVTEERQRDKYVQTQERLATVGQLAAGIAHDFNNIMAVITLYSQSLERNPDHPRRRDHLKTMHKQALRASELIGQILDFSRTSTMERHRMDLVPFIKEVAKLLDRTLPENIVIRRDTDNGEYPVEADPTRLQQVLMNLAVNARDAMPDGGELSIALSRLALIEDEQPPLPDMRAGEYVRVCVRDTGSGIPGDVLPHIFEPFFTTKSVGKGTGLGLAQVYGIVRQHEGVIGVESKPGEGTTFIIYLPLAKPGVLARVGTGPLLDTSAGGEERILVVEDEPAVRAAVHTILTDIGYDVWEAENGQEALSLLQEEAFDLVLSDMVMPGMGGLELRRLLRERHPSVRLMLASGYPLRDESSLNPGQDGIVFIQKPFRADDLTRKVRLVLDGSR